jgi:hypothetical protein
MTRASKTTLTWNEEHLLGMHRDDGANPALYTNNLLTVDGPFNHQLFSQIVTCIVRWNPSLQTNYQLAGGHWTKSITPVTAKSNFVTFFDDATDADVDTFFEQTFQLDQDRLIAFGIFCLGENQYKIAFRGHHLIMDAPSAAILNSMLENCYRFSYQAHLLLRSMAVHAYIASYYVFSSYQLVLNQVQLEREALEDASHPTKLYMQRILNDADNMWLPTATKPQHPAVPVNLFYSHSTYFEYSLLGQIQSFLNTLSANDIKPAHFWVAVIYATLLIHSARDRIKTPARLPVAGRTAPHLGYYSKGALISVDVDISQTPAGLCRQAAQALRASKDFQACPITGDIAGGKLPRVNINYIPLSTTVTIPECKVAPCPRRIPNPAPNWRSDNYAVDADFTIHPPTCSIHLESSVDMHGDITGGEVLKTAVNVASLFTEKPTANLGVIRAEIQQRLG